MSATGWLEAAQNNVSAHNVCFRPKQLRTQTDDSDIAAHPGTSGGGDRVDPYRRIRPARAAADPSPPYDGLL
jgi:hypothetical protein